MEGYTVAYTDANHLSKSQTTKRLNDSFPTTKVKSSTKKRNKCKAISKFRAYSEIGCARNLRHYPQAMQSAHAFPPT